MAYGGMYDQVGGGFHRYSMDDRWLVPHFEKMLYDNALLARAYLDALSPDREASLPAYHGRNSRLRRPRNARSKRRLLLHSGCRQRRRRRQVLRVGTEEFLETVGEDGELLARYFDVTDYGNWEHHNILNVPRPPELFCKLEKISEKDLESKVAAALPKLYAARKQRVHPGRDEKILTDWNGLTLRAFADAAALLGRDDYRKVAEANAEFIFEKLWEGEHFLHSFKDGRARFNAYLDDYANVADGLLALYQLTFDERWLRRSESLAQFIIDRFADEEHGGFYFTARDHEELITRTKDFFDNATPSGNSVAADVLLRLAALLGRDDFRKQAEQTFAAVQPHLAQYASGFGRMLAAVDFAIGPSAEIALVGGTGEFLASYRKQYLPRTVIAAGESDIALLRGRKATDGKPTAFICENLACKQPVTDVSEFEKLLGFGEG